MPAAATVTCPNCHKTFKGRLELDGKKVRCPNCEEAFVVRLGKTLKVDRGGADERIKAQPSAAGKPARTKAAPPPPVPAATADIDLNDIPDNPASAAANPAEAITAGRPPGFPDMDNPDDDDNPYAVTQVDLRARCPNCANPMESEDAVVCLYCGYNTQTRAASRTQKAVELTLGDRLRWLKTGLLAAAGIVLLTAFILFYCLDMHALLAGTWAAFLAHESLRMWFTCIALLIMWNLGLIAFRRLILEPTPPDVVND
jgi:Zn finger protein HypA/HybF involved in hydrogenase expression